MKIKIPKCKFRLFVFALYNLFFVLYMLGKISNIYYLVTISLFCFLNFVTFMSKKKIELKNCFDEFKLGIVYVGVFFIISIIIQFINKDIRLSIIMGDLIRLIIPIVNAFLFVNTIDTEDQKSFFNIFLIRFILQFVLTNLENLTLGNILSISWSDSSSVMESSLAHDFLIMEIFYLMIRNKKNALICMIFCMISMKRLSFILAPILFLISNIVPNGPVKKKHLNILKLFAILSPFIMIGLYSEELQHFLIEHFNFNLNQFMSGRVKIYKILVDNIPYYNGLGSVNSFLSSFVESNFGTTWNAILHNDFLRIYFETTIIGVLVFSNNIVELCKKNYWHYFMVLYLIFVAITSHILNYFSVWVTLYMAVMYYNSMHNSDTEGK